MQIDTEELIRIRNYYRHAVKMFKEHEWIGDKLTNSYAVSIDDLQILLDATTALIDGEIIEDLANTLIELDVLKTHYIDRLLKHKEHAKKLMSERSGEN